MSVNFLDKIRVKVTERLENMPEVECTKRNTLDFCNIFKNSAPSIISEIKFASPSSGKIYKGELDHVSIASEYLSAGASALSVLTEPYYFKGNISYIKDIRSAHTEAHILLKDFIIDKKQLEQGLSYGANAALLIVAFLDETKLEELYNHSVTLGLTPIVEVHDLNELKRALRLHPRIIGINNRNLTTLEVNLDTARTLIKYIPEGCYTICESGIEYAIQMHEMQSIGFHGFLVGSSLMSHEHPGTALRQLLEGGKHEN